jgi:hypothetical protein
MAMDKHNNPTEPLTDKVELSTDEIVVYRKTNANAWIQGKPMDVQQ